MQGREQHRDVQPLAGLHFHRPVPVGPGPQREGIVALVLQPELVQLRVQPPRGLDTAARPQGRGLYRAGIVVVPAVLLPQVEALALAGKEITLPGYMVPFENGMKGSHFILSSLPLNACFFCGVGGPESVVEVFLTDAIPYTDKPIEVKGTLYINTTDPDQMIYVLKNAVLLGEIEF